VSSVTKSSLELGATSTENRFLPLLHFVPCSDDGLNVASICCHSSFLSR
jgi:hypothetical protein